MPRNRAFSEPEYSAEYSADYSVSLPSDPEHGVGRTHEVTVRSSGSCLCLPRFMRLTFAPESLENLYQTYFRRQRHETLLVLVVFAALFDCYVIVMCAVVYSPDKLAPTLVASVGLALQVLLFVLCRYRLLPDRVSRKFMPYVLWLLIVAQIFCYLGLNFARFHEASDTVGWQAFFVFSFFITLPLSLTPIVLISAVACGIHTLVLGVTIAQQQQDSLDGGALLRQARGSNDAESLQEPLCCRCELGGIRRAAAPSASWPSVCIQPGSVAGGRSDCTDEGLGVVLVTRIESRVQQEGSKRRLSGTIVRGVPKMLQTALLGPWELAYSPPMKGPCEFRCPFHPARVPAEAG